MEAGCCLSSEESCRIDAMFDFYRRHSQRLLHGGEAAEVPAPAFTSGTSLQLQRSSARNISNIWTAPMSLRLLIIPFFSVLQSLLKSCTHLCFTTGHSSSLTDSNAPACLVRSLCTSLVRHCTCHAFFKGKESYSPNICVIRQLGKGWQPLPFFNRNGNVIFMTNTY